MTTDVIVRIADGPVRADIRLPSPPPGSMLVHVGRVQLHHDGWRIYPDWPSTDTVIQRTDGGGLTATEAEHVLDSLDREFEIRKGRKPNAEH